MSFPKCVRCGVDHNPFSSCYQLDAKVVTPQAVEVVTGTLSPPVVTKVSRQLKWKRANRERYNKWMKDYRARMKLP